MAVHFVPLTYKELTMNKKRTEALLKRVKPIVCDECHQVSSQAYNKVNLNPNIYHSAIDRDKPGIHSIHSLCILDLFRKLDERIAFRTKTEPLNDELVLCGFLLDNDALCVDCYNSIDEQLSKQVGSPDALVIIPNNPIILHTSCLSRLIALLT